MNISKQVALIEKKLAPPPFDYYDEYAKAALMLLKKSADNIKARTSLFFIHHLSSLRNKILENHTNPLLHNTTKFVERKILLNNIDSVKDSIKKSSLEAYNYLQSSERTMQSTLSAKIFGGSVVAIHGCQPIINKALIKAHKNKKKFSVVVFEGRPTNAGELTKSILKKHIKHIRCSVVLEAEAPRIFSKSDIFFFQPNALFPDGSMICPLGTSLLLNQAKAFGAKAYAVSNTWNTYPMKIKIDKRHEFCIPKDITGFISERGIHSSRNIELLFSNH